MFSYSKNSQTIVFVFCEYENPCPWELKTSVVGFLKINKFMYKRNKGGRPLKEVKRDKRIQISITNDEFEILNKRYLESKIYHSLNEMIRDLLLKNQYKVITTDQNLLVETSILLGSVRKIGNNFNQLLKHLNQKKADNFSTDEKNIIIFNIQEIKKFYIKIEGFFDNNQR